MESGETPGASRSVQVQDSTPSASDASSTGYGHSRTTERAASLRKHMGAALLETAVELQKSWAIFLAMEESEDEDESALVTQAISYFKEPATRVTRYLEDIVPNYNAKQFQSHFRLNWESYQLLENLISPQLNKEGTEFIPARKQLLCILWLLATPDSFRSVGDRFDLPKSSVYNCFLAIIKALVEISALIIKWPTRAEKVKIKEEFRHFARMENCVGAVDGTFIVIKAPKEHQQAYFTRKCCHAMQMQAIAIPSLEFIDIFTGYPGSVGDRRVFTNSNIFKNISNNEGIYFDTNEYILGDKAYPVLSWCIPPYINRGTLNAIQVNFNTKHAQTRQVVERSFALLFGRFRRLKYLDMNVASNIPATILACCVLHNLCLKNRDLAFEAEAIAGGQLFLSSRHIRDGAGRHEEERVSARLGIDGHVLRDSLAASLMH